MFNFKARDFFLAGFILGAIVVALIISFVLIFQARSAATQEPEPVPEKPTRVVEEPTVAPEEPTMVPTTTRAVDPDSLSGLHYVLFNPAKPPLDDVSVRQAFRSLIDRGMLAEIALVEFPELMNTYPTGTMAPRFMQPEGLQDVLMLPYEPDMAMAMLEEAGLDGRLDLVVAVPPEDGWLEVYKDMWEPLGMRLDYVYMDEQSAILAMLDGQVDVYLSPARRLSTDPTIYYRAILEPLYELQANSEELVGITDYIDSLVGSMADNSGSREESIYELESIIVGDMALVIPGFRFGPAERE